MNTQETFGYTTTNVTKENINSSFLTADIATFITNAEYPDFKSVIINNWDDDDNSEELMKNISSELDDNTLYLTTAYCSMKKYPEDKYYLFEPEPEKELLPVDDILNRGSKILEDNNWICINDYIRYEFQKAYVYRNKLGIQLVNYINKLMKNNKEE